MAKQVSGTQEIVNRLMMERSKMLRDVAEAVEKTSVDISNHAKANHQGNMAHASGRYANQTSNLTNSITQVLEKVDYNEVSAISYATMEYAPYVEADWPFFWPALVATQEVLKRRVEAALHR
jgi:hypothetical protein